MRDFPLFHAAGASRHRGGEEQGPCEEQPPPLLPTLVGWCRGGGNGSGTPGISPKGIDLNSLPSSSLKFFSFETWLLLWFRTALRLPSRLPPKTALLTPCTGLLTALCSLFMMRPSILMSGHPRYGLKLVWTLLSQISTVFRGFSHLRDYKDANCSTILLVFILHFLLLQKFLLAYMCFFWNLLT